MRIERYTNRQRRNNILRSLCHRFVRQQMPKAYAILQGEAQRIYENQRSLAPGGLHHKGETADAHRAKTHSVARGTCSARTAETHYGRANRVLGRKEETRAMGASVRRNRDAVL